MSYVANNESEHTPYGRRTYSETVSRGLYGRYVGGLSGKYDNVRTFWEDEVTRLTLRPFLDACVARCHAEARGVRVLDLGSGGGQGYELLTSIPMEHLGLDADLRCVLSPAEIDCYLGVDVSEAMIGQGRENYRDVPQARFTQLDLREGLGLAAEEPPFDVYFSSYGSLSHLGTADLRRLVLQIAAHARPGALIVFDLVGRLSPEWPGYWAGRTEADAVREYSMSYLYTEEERAFGRVERFPLRFWTGDELRQFCADLQADAPRSIALLRSVDRSIFTGRHVDTREYQPLVPALRQVVNRLFEPDVRTNLDDLVVTLDANPGGHDGAGEFLAEFAGCWNVLVECARARVAGTRLDLVRMEGWRDFPPALQHAVMNVDRVVDSVSGFRTSDVRANVVEPQLAYLLRDLEMALQKGLGCGHGLMAVLQVGPAGTPAAMG